jgi:hypothetical protein
MRIVIITMKMLIDGLEQTLYYIVRSGDRVDSPKVIKETVAWFSHQIPTLATWYICAQG